MSYIAFGSDAGEVLIGGAERARMSVLIDRVAWAMESRGRMRGGPVDDYHAEIAYCGPFSETNFGERLGWWCLIADDVAKLLAHVHGQCEMHGWVHPDDRDWFADLVDRAAGRGLLNDDRPGQYGTWADVAALARRSTAPLVTSYSVCESWPDPHAIASERPDLFNPVGNLVGADDALYDAWAALTDDDRARIADEAITTMGPRWHPAEWGTHWVALVSGRRPYASSLPTEWSRTPPTSPTNRV